MGVTVVNVSIDGMCLGLPKCVGWEKNEKDKLVPKVVNLSSSMDPVRYVSNLSILVKVSRLYR